MVKDLLDETIPLILKFEKTDIPPVPGAPKRKELGHYPAVKLKNFQWQKLEGHKVENTVWTMDGINEKEFEEVLHRTGEFEKLESTFPAKVNTLFERKLKAKMEERRDAVKFLSKEKTRNLSKSLLIPLVHVTYLLF